MRQQPIPAYVLANALAGCVAYAGLGLWAFSHRRVYEPTNSVVRFFGLSAATLLIPITAWRAAATSWDCPASSPTSPSSSSAGCARPAVRA
jgi:putative flippase GtrA